MERIAKECRPKLIVAGASAYGRTLDFKRFREIADMVGAYLMVDIAHIAGLLATGQHPSPIPYADVTTTTTHKTLRGPRGGLILSSEEFAKEHKLNKAVFPGIQGGPLMHVIASKAVCLKEALSPEFQEYGKQVVKNAKTLCQGLMDRGIPIVSGGTDNHLMLVNLAAIGRTGKEVENLLDSVRSPVSLCHQRPAPGHAGSYLQRHERRGHGSHCRNHRQDAEGSGRLCGPGKSKRKSPDGKISADVISNIIRKFEIIPRKKRLTFPGDNAMLKMVMRLTEVEETTGSMIL